METPVGQATSGVDGGGRGLARAVVTRSTRPPPGRRGFVLRAGWVSAGLAVVGLVLATCGPAGAGHGIQEPPLTVSAEQL